MKEQHLLLYPIDIRVSVISQKTSHVRKIKLHVKPSRNMTSSGTSPERNMTSEASYLPTTRAINV